MEGLDGPNDGEVTVREYIFCMNGSRNGYALHTQKGNGAWASNLVYFRFCSADFTVYCTSLPAFHIWYTNCHSSGCRYVFYITVMYYLHILHWMGRNE